MTVLTDPSFLIWCAGAAVDVPLLAWALRDLPTRRREGTALRAGLLVLETVVYMVVRRLLLDVALWEMPLLTLLFAALVLVRRCVRPANALLLAALYASLLCVLVSAAYKVVDFAGLGLGEYPTEGLSVALGIAAKVWFAWYCHRHVEPLMAMGVEWIQVTVVALLWPVTVCVLAYNRDAVTSPAARFLAQPPMLVFLVCSLAVASVLWVVEYASYHESRRNIERLEWALRSQRERYEQSREYDERLRRIRHDIKYVYAYLAEGTVREGRTQQAIESVFRELSVPDAQPLTGNGAADAVLRDAAMRARREGVSVTSYMDLTAGDFVDDLDYVCVLGNALDNAIEAAREVDDPERRVVQAKAALINGHLVMTVGNWFKGERRERGGKLVTTKGHPWEHGLGLASIAQALAKYDGAVTYEMEGDRFELRMVVPVPLR